MSSFLFKKASRFRFLNFVIVFLAMSLVVPVYAQKSSLKTYKNPSVDAMKLRGDVSCMKVYHNSWSTEFGERVDGEPVLEHVLYFDSEHRLVCLEDWESTTKAKYEAGNDTPFKIYVYEYEYDANGNLATIDCWSSMHTFVNYFLEWKMKLVNESGVIVAHKYNGYGVEIDRLKPYNAISQGILSTWFHVENDEYVFAFDMVSERLMSTFADEKNKSKVRADYYWQYNNNNQLVKLSKGSSEAGFLNAYFSYDDKGNLAVIDIHSWLKEGSGNKWTMEYTYGDFEESAKHSYESRMEEIKKKAEREQAIKDSIKVAKAEEMEYQRKRQATLDSLAKVKEKEAELQRVMQDSVKKVKVKEYMEKQKKEQKREKIKRRVGGFLKSILGDCKRETFDAGAPFKRLVAACSYQMFLKGSHGFSSNVYSSFPGGCIIDCADYANKIHSQHFG